MNQAFEDHDNISAYTASGSWDWTPNSRILNEVRFGYDKVLFDFFPADSSVIANGTGYPIDTGITSPGGLPNIQLSGFEKLGTWHNRPYYFHTPYFDGQNSFSYLMGKHTFKFGVEVAHIEVDSASYDNGRGRIDFQGGQTAGLTSCGGTSCPLEDFFAGKPSRGYILAGDPVRATTWMSYAGFVQDDWRLNQKVTLNLGLRYSYVSPMEEANGLVKGSSRRTASIREPSTPAATLIFVTASPSRPATTFRRSKAMPKCWKAGKSTGSSPFNPASLGPYGIARTTSPLLG